MAMYRLRTKDCPETDLAKRWALPDRVFFACGACHILAYAFLTRYDGWDARAVWIKPNAGHTGNHVVVSFGDTVFDYHGYSKREDYLDHYWKRAIQAFPNWNASLVELPTDVLISESKSRTYDGLWLRQPDQYYRNALPRAHEFLARFSHPETLQEEPREIVSSSEIVLAVHPSGRENPP